MLPFGSAASIKISRRRSIVLTLGAGEEKDETGIRRFTDMYPRGASKVLVCLKVYLMGVVRAMSLESRTKTASSFAGSVLLALRLIEWIAPGGSDQLSPAR